uniref:helix-turn-helix domain-containing protein n=1 Tax=Bacteroides caccae TaxID=47678 RepID=UPI0034A393F7
MLEYAPPRVTCADHGVTVAMMPWARRKSTYTRDFEQQTALLNVHAPRSAVSRLMRMDWKSVGPVCRRVADDLRAEQGPGLFDGPRSIGVDETSHRKGHTYITVVVDHERHRVIWAHDGCVCSIESGPCERVDVFHVSGRFWSTSACGEKRTPARPAWTSFPS